MSFIEIGVKLKDALLVNNWGGILFKVLLNLLKLLKLVIFVIYY